MPINTVGFRLIFINDFTKHLHWLHCWRICVCVWLSSDIFDAHSLFTHCSQPPQIPHTLTLYVHVTVTMWKLLSVHLSSDFSFIHLASLHSCLCFPTVLCSLSSWISWMKQHTVHTGLYTCGTRTYIYYLLGYCVVQVIVGREYLLNSNESFFFRIVGNYLLIGVVKFHFHLC